MSTGSPMLPCAAPRMIAACNTALMMTPMTTPASRDEDRRAECSRVGLLERLAEDRHRLGLGREDHAADEGADEREGHDDDRHDHQQVGGVRLVDLERGAQDLPDAALREAWPSCASLATGRRRRRGRGGEATRVVHDGSPFSERTEGILRRSRAGVGCATASGAAQSTSSGRSRGPHAGSGRQEVQSRSNGGSRASRCSIARSPARRASWASASVTNPRRSASTSSSSSFHSWVSRAGGGARRGTSPCTRARRPVREAATGCSRSTPRTPSPPSTTAAPRREFPERRTRARGRSRTFCSSSQGPSWNRTSPWSRGSFSHASRGTGRTRDVGAPRPRRRAPGAAPTCARARPRAA